MVLLASIATLRPPFERWVVQLAVPLTITADVVVSVQTPVMHEANGPHTVPQAPQLLLSVAVVVQALPHATCLPGHTHAPAVQLSPAATHAFPHDPQLALSVANTAQYGAAASEGPPAPQTEDPDGHAAVHAPRTHCPPAPHALPHPPQFCSSSERSAQNGTIGPGVLPSLLPASTGARAVGLQRVNPAWHEATQAPIAHVIPAAHALPHPPQFAASDWGSTQAVPPLPLSMHTVNPDAQVPVQLPPTHASPAEHAFPHAPQLWGSTASSTHALPHFVVPPPHASAQDPPTHACPAAQGLPQLPQLSKSVCVSTHASPQTDVAPVQVGVVVPPSRAGVVALPHPAARAIAAASTEGRKTEGAKLRKGEVTARSYIEVRQSVVTRVRTPRASR